MKKESNKYATFDAMLFMFTTLIERQKKDENVILELKRDNDKMREENETLHIKLKKLQNKLLKVSELATEDFDSDDDDHNQSKSSGTDSDHNTN